MELSEEIEDINRKFSIKIWGRVLKYTLEKWPLLIVLFVTVLITTFFDSAFTPLMNASAIQSLEQNITLSIPFSEVTFRIQFLGIYFGYLLLEL